MIPVGSQELVEMMRLGNSGLAFAHAKKHLSVWAKDNMGEFKRAVAMLAFGPTAAPARYRNFFAEGAWGRLKAEFRRDFYRLHALPPDSLLQVPTCDARGDM